MSDTVGVRELRQNLSKYLERVKAGETLTVTERGHEVARIVRSGPDVTPYARELAEKYGATVATRRLEDVLKELDRTPHPAGTTDAFLDESRRDRW
jgi:prevent-host-death family protein